ncbi:MAG: HAD family hydrolase [Bacteroidales bacterium]
MPFSTFIFDLDGTLANTQLDLANAMNRVLSKHGYPLHSAEEYKYLVGKGLRNLVKGALPLQVQNSTNITLCLDEMMADYGHNYLIDTHIYDGIGEVLDCLQAKGVKVGVLSNKADAITQKIIKELFAKWTFDLILGLSEAFPRKPKADSILYMCKQMGVKPQDVLYLGDSGVDMELAINANIYGVGVLWGFRTAEELKQNGAKELIETPKEILKYL